MFCVVGVVWVLLGLVLVCWYMLCLVCGRIVWYRYWLCLLVVLVMLCGEYVLVICYLLLVLVVVYVVFIVVNWFRLCLGMVLVVSVLLCLGDYWCVFGILLYLVWYRLVLLVVVILLVIVVIMLYFVVELLVLVV